MSEVFSWFPYTFVLRRSLPLNQIKQFFDYSVFTLNPSSSDSNFTGNNLLDLIFFFSFYFFRFRPDLFS